MQISIFAFIVFLCVPRLALSWGDLGHKAISEAVQANLEPATMKALARIGGAGDELPIGTLARLSLWPDQLRAFMQSPNAVISGFTTGDLKEARAFVNAHPDHAEWHYVDLPLGSHHYPDLIRSDDFSDPVLRFTRPNDIVQMIQRCIDILEAETESHEFTRLQALRWLCTSSKIFTSRFMSRLAITVPRRTLSLHLGGSTILPPSPNKMPRMTAAEMSYCSEASAVSDRSNGGKSPCRLG